MKRQISRAVLAALLTSSIAPLGAQAPPGQQAPYQPPSMRFDGPGLTLADAVRLTLQNDPTIKLRDADVAFRQGLLRSQRGLFDYIFKTTGTFSRTQSELLDSEKLEQIEVRDDLRTAIVEVTDLSNSLLTAGALLRDRNLALNNPGSMNLSTIKDKNVFNQMSILQAELLLYRDILASPLLTDATVRADIINLREQTIGKNIDAFTAQQTAIASAPGQLQNKLDNLGPAPNERWIKQGRFTADVNKLFRTGLTIRPFADLSYNKQNFVGKDRTSTEFGGAGIEPLSQGQIGFDVVLPLLRGAGRDNVAAAETASQFDLEASRLAMLFQQSQSVLTTVQAYWQARAAADRVEVLRRSVEVQGQLGNVTRAMIAADEKPRSEEARSLAMTADVRARYESAQRQLIEARINLAQVMGVALADALSIPLASDAFPEPPAGLQGETQAYAGFVSESVARRFDHQAAVKAESSRKTILLGARKNVRPFLDVSASGWGTSVQQSSLSYPDWVFRSGRVGISYEQFLGNNVAKGTVAAREASANQAQIEATNIARVVSLRVIQLAESLKVAADRLRSAAEAVTSYEQTIAAEQTRFRAGDSSLLDTILTEQQTLAARLAYLAAQQEYAQLLASLRHEAGLLVQDGNVDPSQLVVPPPVLVRR